MNNREYTTLVNAGIWPEDPTVPLDEPFENSAGFIQNLVLENFTSATYIYSGQNSIRSNHYHKTDWHYMFVVNGEMHYYWRPAGSKSPPQKRIYKAGEMMFTPPLVEHATFFPLHTDLMTFARNVRDTEHHEADLVRVPIIKFEDGKVVFCP